jgi:hypothetical protein
MTALNRLKLLALILLPAALCSCATVAGSMTQRANEAPTQAVVAATTAFLDSLSADQRAKVQFAFTPQPKASAAKFNKGGRMPFVGEQYGAAVWSNFPVDDVPRPGLALGTLSAAQRDAATRLLQTLLSAKGYQKVMDVMNSDQALADKGTPYKSGIAHYTLGIFGTPSVNTPWMVQYGGHHLAINVTIAGKFGVATPTLTGSQPALYTLNGKAVRALSQENDKAFALMESLDEAQRKQALLNYQVRDLVLGPGYEGVMIQPEGIKAAALNAKQQTMLLDLIAEWAGIVNDSYASARMAELKADLSETWFAWSGPLTHEPNRNGTAYYRIQGPRVIIEFAPQGVGGDPSNHVHTIYRDPTNDYGARLVKK